MGYKSSLLDGRISDIQIGKRENHHDITQTLSSRRAREVVIMTTYSNTIDIDDKVGIVTSLGFPFSKWTAQMYMLDWKSQEKLLRYGTRQTWGIW